MNPWAKMNKKKKEKKANGTYRSNMTPRATDMRKKHAKVMKNKNIPNDSGCACV